MFNVIPSLFHLRIFFDMSGNGKSQTEALFLKLFSGTFKSK
jgi:hypothetical protein